MLRFLLIVLIVILLFRIIRNFLRGYLSVNQRDNSKKATDYKDIQEANYIEIKDEEKN